MRAWHCVLPWLLLVVAGCATSPVPAETSFGLAWGRDAAEAASAARLIDEAAASVVRHLPGAVVRPFDTHMVDLDELNGRRREFSLVPGAHHVFANGERRVLLSAVDGELARRTAVHELVHAFVDPCWDSLPQALEEAVADYVACLDARSRGVFRDWDMSRAVLATDEHRLFVSVLVDGAVAVTGQPDMNPPWTNDDLLKNLLLPDEALRSEDERSVPARATAFFVVQRIAGRDGLAGLRALCESLRDRDSTELCRALLARAGLRDACDLADAAREAIDPRLAEQLAREFAATTNLDDWLAYAGPDAELLIVVEGIHHVRAAPDWFMRGLNRGAAQEERESGLDE